MDSKMDSKTAFTNIRAVMTHYKSFQHLEGIIEVAIAAEANAEELEKRIVDLGRRLTTATSRTRDAEGKAGNAEKNAQNRVIAAEATASEAVGGIGKVRVEAEAEHIDALNNLSKGLEVAKKDHDRAIKKLEDDMAGMEQVKAELEAALDAVRARVAAV